MKVLVVGAGAREHAIAWRLSQDGSDVYVAPGNGGTANSVPLQASRIDELAELACREGVNLTIVGPEAPLAAGLVDRFTELGLIAFGPTQAAAQLEWSKAWTKSFLERHQIPTALAEVAETEQRARRAIQRSGLPVVLKADGLASGKGVFVARTAEDVEVALEHLFQRLGDAARRVLIEECLEGPELSVLAFTDGERVAVMPPVRDYKRLLDDDRGPNTGGMGGYTWPAYATPELLVDVEQRILRPTLAGMQAEGRPYRGVLYAGLMLTSEGPKVLVFNCRFGDPECEVILPLLASNLAEVCLSVAAGELAPDGVRWRKDRSYGVVVAAPGYPDAPEIGDAIDGLEALPPGVQAFHGGTRVGDDGRLVTAGGRVLTLVGRERERVYQAAEGIQLSGKQFRRDIGVEVDSVVGASR